MNTISQLAVTLSRTLFDKDGKATQFKRHFTNLNTDETPEQLKSFKSIIEQITGEHFDKLEVIKTETIN
ncbi:sigS mRNA-stabilizing protein SroA [Staphylococcus caeli]|uniref:sigS mRNA-stabilizing protein SroA n=1 Tax=Staphylococcus caeli TaxID=2201815 RepID=UPI003F57F799